MLKRRSNNFEGGRKRARVHRDLPQVSEYNSRLIEFSLQELTLPVNEVKQKFSAHPQKTADHLKKVHEYLFDPQNSEEGKKWVTAMLKNNSIRSLKLFMVNIAILLRPGGNSTDSMLGERKPEDVSFLKWILHSMAEYLSKHPGDNLAIRTVQSILYSLVTFVAEEFILEETIKGIDASILELLQVALVNANTTSPKMISQLMHSLGELARRGGLKDLISIQTINILLKGFVKKINNASTRNAEDIILSLGELAWNKCLIVEANAETKINIDYINSLLQKLLACGADGRGRNITIASSNTGGIIYSLTHLARLTLLGGSISIEDANVMLEILVYYLNKQGRIGWSDIINISKTLCGLGGLSKEKFLGNSLSSDNLLNINSINSLLRALLSDAHRFNLRGKPSDVLYWLGELSKNGHLRGQIELNLITSLLQKLTRTPEGLTLSDINNAIDGLGNLISAGCIYGLINIGSINPLLKNMNAQWLVAENKDELDRRTIINAIKVIARVMQEGYVNGQIDAIIINSLSDIVIKHEKDTTHIDGFLENIGIIKGERPTRQHAINVTSIPWLSDSVLTASQRELSSWQGGQDLLISSAQPMYDPFSEQEDESANLKEIYNPFSEQADESTNLKEIYNPFSEQEDEPANLREVYNPFSEQEDEPANLREIYSPFSEQENGLTNPMAIYNLANAEEMYDFYSEQEDHRANPTETYNSFTERESQLGENHQEQKAQANKQSEKEVDKDNSGEDDETPMQTIEEEIDWLGTGRGIVHEAIRVEPARREQDEHDGMIIEEPGIEGEEAPIEVIMGAEERAVIEQPAEAEILGTILGFIKVEDINGLNHYLNLPRHHCNEKVLPNDQGIYYPHPERTATAAPRENRYDGIIKTFFEEHCNTELLRRTGHQYFISLLKAGSRTHLYELWRGEKLIPLILHLPLEELRLFIHDSVTPLRVQQDSTSVLKVLDTLCLRYEVNCSDERFVIEKLIKLLFDRALASHKEHPVKYPEINNHYRKVLRRLKKACAKTISNELGRLQNHTNTVGGLSSEPRAELEAISTLIHNLTEPMQELIANNLDANKQDQLGEGTRFRYINITWILSMACVYLQLEKQVADYRRDNGNRNVGAAAQYGFFATHAANRVIEMRAINHLLSRLGGYVKVYRDNCEKIAGGGIISTDRLGGRISQCYRDYENTVARIESQRANPGRSMRASA